MWLRKRCSAAPKNGPSKWPKPRATPANSKNSGFHCPPSAIGRAVLFSRLPLSVRLTFDFLLLPLVAFASARKIQLIESPCFLRSRSLRHQHLKFLRPHCPRSPHRAYPQRVPPH